MSSCRTGSWASSCALERFDPDRGIEQVLSAVEADDLRALLAGLSDRERRLLRMRYGPDGDELSLRDVGDRLGVSGERVRQIERRALAKLAVPAAHGA